MCGISGAISKDLNSEIMMSMNDEMLHRGPDDFGIYINQINNKNIGLGQRRLSIIDLSPLGHQPMLSSDEDIAIVFNGEIYNYLDIKETLIKDGYSFKSNSDTEVIIYAYKKWGIDFISKLNGMFAIGLFDKKSDKFYLIRDRMGIKPIYYYWDGENLAFASEIKPILKFPGFKKDVDLKVLKGYFQYLNVNAPRTIFKKLYKLEPGEVLEYVGGTINLFKYWELPKIFNDNLKENISYSEAENLIEGIIDDSVRRRLLSDVPVGTFLSGGVDSTLVTMFAQKNSKTPVNTFSIGFNDEKFNEAEYAKDISKFLGTSHNEVYVNEKEMLDTIMTIPKYFDEPFSDSSQIPTMLVSKLAREKVTVALSGDGGDELFCGYNSYDALKKLQKMRKFTYAPGLISTKLGLKDMIYNYNWKIGTLLESYSKKGMVNFNYLNFDYFLKDLFIDKDQYDTYYDFPNIKSNNIIEAKMVLDAMTYMPNDILTKVDRASMKYSLEARTPLLDYRLVEASFRIKHEYKIFNGDKKHILKNIIKKEIPAEMIERPKKGFSVPLNKWLTDDLAAVINQYTNEKYIKNQNIFNFEKIDFIKKERIRNYSSTLDSVLWSLFMFQLWYEEYIN